MKITLKNLTLLAYVLLIPITGVTAEESAAKEEPSAEQVKAEKAVIKSLNELVVQASSVILAHMTDDNVDLGTTTYEMPEKLEGIQLVKVDVVFPFVAKYDLYLKKKVLSDLVNKPVVIEKEHSKGDRVAYVKLRFVVKADGKGAYKVVQQGATKTDIDNLKSKSKSSFGKNILVYGSDGYKAAIKATEKASEPEVTKVAESKKTKAVEPKTIKPAESEKHEKAKTDNDVRKNEPLVITADNIFWLIEAICPNPLETRDFIKRHNNSYGNAKDEFEREEIYNKMKPVVDKEFEEMRKVKSVKVTLHSKIKDYDFSNKRFPLAVSKGQRIDISSSRYVQLDSVAGMTSIDMPLEEAKKLQEPLRASRNIQIEIIGDVLGGDIRRNSFAGDTSRLRIMPKSMKVFLGKDKQLLVEKNLSHTQELEPARRACIRNLENIQKAARAYQTLNELKHGDALDWDNLMKDGYLENKPTCPSGGTYSYLSTLPELGKPAAECSHSKKLNHKPEDSSNW